MREKLCAIAASLGLVVAVCLAVVVVGLTVVVVVALLDGCELVIGCERAL